MSCVIGVDIGGSQTKVVGITPERGIMKPIQVKANNPVASLYGAFGQFVSENGLELSSISKVMITGVGSSHVFDPIYGLGTGRVAEFSATGFGGLFLSGLERAVIVSMGTGTAMIKADENGIAHLGGTGVGGGTVIGLSSAMLGMRDYDEISELASGGNLSRIDLLVGDISAVTPSSKLRGDTTAANFGKVSDMATKADLAYGILNMVFETIGMLAIFATSITGLGDVVLTGNISTNPKCHDVFNKLHEMSGVRFCVPKYSEYATAIGAALAYLDGAEYTEI